MNSRHILIDFSQKIFNRAAQNGQVGWFKFSAISMEYDILRFYAKEHCPGSVLQADINIYRLFVRCEGEVIEKLVEGIATVHSQL